MVVAASRPDPLDEGYPRSSVADLDPGPEVSESLDEADLVASDEHRVVPDHQRQGESADDDDPFDDVDDAGSG